MSDIPSPLPTSPLEQRRRERLLARLGKTEAPPPPKKEKMPRGHAGAIALKAWRDKVAAAKAAGEPLPGKPRGRKPGEQRRSGPKPVPPEERRARAAAYSAEYAAKKRLEGRAGTSYQRKIFSAKEVLEDPARRGGGILSLELPDERPAAIVSPQSPSDGSAAVTVADDAAPKVLSDADVPPDPKYPKITPQAVWDLGKLSCTQEEAAGWFRISPPTFRKLLREHPSLQEGWDSGQHTGRVSFRRLQLAAAAGGNAAMMIFLGKNLLGQKDNAALQVNTTDGGTDKQAAVDRLLKAAERMASRGRGEHE